MTWWHARTSCHGGAQRLPQACTNGKLRLIPHVLHELSIHDMKGPFLVWFLHCMACLLHSNLQNSMADTCSYEPRCRGGGEPRISHPSMQHGLTCTSLVCYLQPLKAAHDSLHDAYSCVGCTELNSNKRAHHGNLFTRSILPIGCESCDGVGSADRRNNRGWTSCCATKAALTRRKGKWEKQHCLWVLTFPNVRKSRRSTASLD